MVPGGRSSEGRRPNRPHDLGPRVYRRGRWFHADLRPWGGERGVLRNPEDPGWPLRGERTEDEDIAREWSWAYVRLHDGSKRRRLLGIPEPRYPRLDEAVERWLEHRSHTVAANTVQNSRTATAHLLEGFGPARNPAEIDARALQELFDDRVRCGYRPSTLRAVSGQIARFFEWVGLEGPANPAGYLKLPAVHYDEARAWDDDEIGELRDAADYVDRHPWKGQPECARLVVELLLATGVRQQESRAIRREDFDRGTRTARITRQFSREGARAVRLKGKRSRTALVLPSWWEHHRAGTGLVLSRGAKPLGNRTLVNLANRVLDAARLGGEGRFHIFRHTYARLFMEAGGEWSELQASLGHRSVSTTQETYGHFAPDRAAARARARIYPEERIRAV